MEHAEIMDVKTPRVDMEFTMGMKTQEMYQYLLDRVDPNGIRPTNQRAELWAMNHALKNILNELQDETEKEKLLFIVIQFMPSIVLLNGRKMGLQWMAK